MKRATLAYAAPTIVVRPIRSSDAADVERLISERWGECVVARGVQYFPAQLPGFLALQGRQIVGLLTYQAGGTEWEIVTIDSWRPGGGVGTALLQALREAAQVEGVVRVWLVTTNDNLDALRFYQRRGFKLVAVHADAVESAREIKPAIPATGAFDIPIRDELELEMRLPAKRRRSAPKSRSSKPAR